MDPSPVFIDAATGLPMINNLTPPEGFNINLGGLVKGQAAEVGTGVLIDPSLTTISPFAAGAIESQFLTPSTASTLSPRSSIDYFTDPRASFSACSDTVAPHDTVTPNSFLFARNPTPAINAAAPPPPPPRLQPPIPVKVETLEGPGRTVIQLPGQTEASVTAPAPAALTPVSTAAFATASTSTLVAVPAVPAPVAAPVPTPVPALGPPPSTRPRRQRAAIPDPAREMPPQPQPKRNRGHKSSFKKSESQRTKNLERNRIAASKCRQKKKEWVQELEETKAAKEQRYKDLRMECLKLMEESTIMKNRLMSHANCNDSNIDFWIEQEATRFVEKCNEERREKIAAAAAENEKAAAAKAEKAIAEREAEAPIPPPDLQDELSSEESPDMEDMGSPEDPGHVNLDYMEDELLNSDTLQDFASE